MKKYLKPELEIIKIESGDVIMTSMPQDDDADFLSDGSIELPGISLN
jgi:hypothetical protein